MYNFTIHLHIAVSVAVIFIGLITLLRAAIKHNKHKTYTKADVVFRIGLNILLYFQLITGVLMYFFLRPYFDGKYPHTLMDAERMEKCSFG
ncbi:MAG: hypothetical protein HC896_07720 [Bacteroidales bacterium]|nr:hypothetical protein [Bacteroidales bacterium]